MLGIFRMISIHALREEGDSCIFFEQLLNLISIHALREEGDTTLSGRVDTINSFLSTPSARRATSTPG